jgi:hypothetical protein
VTSNRSPKELPNQLPFLNDLIAEYLGRPAIPEAVVQLKGDASSRQYYRVVLPDGERPETLILMALPGDALRSDEVTGGARPKQLPFIDVARHLSAAGLRVPEIYLDAVDRGALLIEDLGDALLGDAVRDASEDHKRAWYFAAADLLKDMHQKMWPLPHTCIAASRSFDYDLLRWELDHYREWGAEALRGSPLDAPVRQRLDRAFDALAREVDELPKGFVHRDYQSRNLMVLAPAPQKESLGIIDFQDAFKGPRVYDLVALLNDSYVSLEEELKSAVIARYAGARKIDEIALQLEFDLVTVQRKLKDGARFVFIDRVKNNPSYLPFVDISFERAKAALARIPGHEELKSALAEADPARFG